MKVTRLSAPTLLAASAPVLMLALLTGSPVSGLTQRRPSSPVPETSRVPVVFSGGYETDPRDRGRPVVLIAAALGVPGEVFRTAFRHVRPAPAGQEPDPEQVRRNKDALLNALGRYGVTNERLDAVSNYYRYNGRRGERWRHRDAAAYANIRDGKVTGFTITDPGAGYCSAPTVTLPGREHLTLHATVAFGIDLEKNGSITTLRLVETENGRSR